ncbi:DUF2294 domain-containing protein [Planomicrobium sp. CPCC 101110]|uniref:DUF2294 domain-containing protein n=1 Tax=Planomicrobium sp. CPCC 101110 TaxID=2599619 RepID=UPI0011B774F9|nr:Na-translocating system protein MpsC family protein [Planomicrobium sp. CPCC 101110]TWT25992.1 DUF2294 family protein [Planomicrobium sp. CPCC 101110]
MNTERQLQSEIGGYISTLMRKHFGKGPTSVYVTLQSEFLTIHLRGFLAPMEKILIKQNEQNRVIKTRDLLMRDISEDIIKTLNEIAQLEVRDIYADWSLETETGLLIGILKQPVPGESFDWPEDVNEKELYGKIEEASRNVEKLPEATEIVWLSDRTIMIKRSKILVELERELIKNGFEEELRIAKRPLEHKAIKAVDVEAALNRKIRETFFDWDFEKDEGYMVFILESSK